MRHMRGLVSVYGEGSVKEARTDSQRNVVGNQKMTEAKCDAAHSFAFSI